MEALHRLELVGALTEQVRAFSKPLRYDAKAGSGLATALHVVGMEEKAAQQKAVAGLPPGVWVWHMDKPMPALPPVARSRISGTASA